MARVELEIPEELWAALEACAHREGRSTNELILEAISWYLAEHRQPGPGLAEPSDESDLDGSKLEG